MRRIVLICVLFSTVMLGCKKDGTSDDTVFTDAPALTGQEYSLNWGPLAIPVGQENTMCVWMRLGNDAPIKVHQILNTLADTSHHLIIYKDDMDTTEQLTPIKCLGFTGALNPTGQIAPLVITQKRDDEVTLPPGVAYTLGAHQMIKIELHFINSTDAEAMATAQVNFFAADPATIHDEASILFAGSLDIDIPAQQQFTLHQFLTLPSSFDLSTSHIFAITGHTHKLGTNVQINTAPVKGGAMTPVYTPTPFSWAEPLTTTFSPAINVPKGGGFDFTCQYTNTTDQAVKFGESANQEMCFFWVYYYPAQTTKVCAHTDQYGGAGGYDLCCPGDSVCSLITSKL